MTITAADPAAIAAAARHLREGRLVAFPTETVYGLGVDATNAAAVARLYAAKGRPLLNPLIVHVAAAAEARALAHFTRHAIDLARAFWPGPLTLLADRPPDCPVPLIVSAGLDSLALRCPAHAIAQALIRAAGRPIAAPSANRAGRLSPTMAADVAADFTPGELAMILDGGPCRLGLESTIIDTRGPSPRLLRPGAIARAAIEAVLGRALEQADSDPSRPQAPGALESHYAPRALVRLDARRVEPGEAVLAFGPLDLDHSDRAVAIVNLSPAADLVEAAANLYAALRRLDASGAGMIAVAAIPQSGLGEAINDRLKRAAAAR